MYYDGTAVGGLTFLYFSDTPTPLFYIQDIKIWSKKVKIESIGILVIEIWNSYVATSLFLIICLKFKGLNGEDFKLEWTAQPVRMYLYFIGKPKLEYYICIYGP